MQERREDEQREDGRETKENPADLQAAQGQQEPRKRNWITDIYDRINVSVKTLDILIVLLCALIVFLFVFGNQIQLGF